MIASARILPVGPNIKPLWLPADPSEPKRRRKISSLIARLSRHLAGEIVFARRLHDDGSTVDQAIRSAEVGDQVYLQAVFPRPISSEDRLTLQVSTKGGPDKADQTILGHTVPTLSETWNMGHVTPAGERFFPSGPVPGPRDTYTLVVFSKPTEPLAIGDYQFSLRDESGQILSSGHLAVLVKTPKK